MIKLSFKNKKKAQSERNSWVITHASGNLSAGDAVKDEEFPNSYEDGASSESSDSDDSSNVLFCSVERQNATSFKMNWSKRSP